MVIQSCGEEEQGQERLQQAQVPSERRLSPHVSPGFALLLWFDSRCSVAWIIGRLIMQHAS